MGKTLANDATLCRRDAATTCATPSAENLWRNIPCFDRFYVSAKSVLRGPILILLSWRGITQRWEAAYGKEKPNPSLAVMED